MKQTHLHLSEYSGGWFIHHPKDRAGKKEERIALSLTSYAGKIDAYRAAIKKAKDDGSSELYIYIHGQYRPDKNSLEFYGIHVIHVDLMMPEGREKFREAADI